MLPHTTASSAVTIGRRLRAERERQGISLPELAGRISAPPSAVAQVERGEAMPSIGMLHALTSELGLTLDGVVGPSSGASGRPAAAASVVRRDDRRAITLASGARWEQLAGETADAELLRVTYPVGSQSCDPGQPLRHAGTERGVVLRGRLGVTLGDDHHELGPGDAISFGADVPHRLWAVGAEPAEVLWFVAGRNGR